MAETIVRTLKICQERYLLKKSFAGQITRSLHAVLTSIRFYLPYPEKPEIFTKNRNAEHFKIQAKTMF